MIERKAPLSPYPQGDDTDLTRPLSLEAQRRLHQRLIERVDALGTPRREPAAWVPVFEGAEVQTLRFDADLRRQITLWRLAPGARIPRHTHSAREECVVLEGAIVHAGQRHAAGDFLVAEPGSRHQPFDSPEGALLLIRGEPVPRFGRFMRWLLRRLRL